MDIDIKGRIENASAVFAAPVFAVWVAGCGITNTALSILTLGDNKTINEKADKLEMIYHVLPLMLQGTMGIINPTRGVVKYYNKNYEAFGILTEKIAKPILGYAEDATRKDGFWKKHVVSRISYAFRAVALTATRTADLALGVLAAPFAIISYGFFGNNNYGLLGEAKNVRNFAMRQLTFCGLLNDICFSIRGFVNPQQFIPESYRFDS